MAPPLLPFDNIDRHRKTIISKAIADVYNIHTPRNFQIEAINHLAANDNAFLVLIRRTSDGKSIVPLTVALLRNGVAIILVPLHGLGSDQVEKANLPSSGVEAYYVSEHKNADASALRKRLHSFSLEEAEEVTIILFVSPSSLSRKSRHGSLTSFPP